MSFSRSTVSDGRSPIMHRSILLGLITLLAGSLGMVQGQSADPATRSSVAQTQVLLPFITGGTGVVPPPTPEAMDDIYQTPVGAPLVVDAAGGVLTNDTGSGPLEAVLVDDVAHGDLALNADGSFTYTPAPQFVGEDSFTYRADDGTFLSNVATVRLIVTESAIPPTVSDDAYETPVDTPLVIGVVNGVLANDTGAGPLQAVLVDDVSHGNLTLDGNGSFTYTPAPQFTGEDSFAYRADDGVAQSNVATVHLIVTEEPPTPPLAMDDAYETPQGTALTVNAADGVLANDSGAGPLQAALISDVSSGTLTFNADGSFVYTPAAGFIGQDSFTYKASDGAAVSNIATVTIMVTGIDNSNEPPQIVTNQIAFTKKVIDDKVRQVHAVVAADLDGDGDIDMVATNYVNGEVYWYENDGTGEFTKRVLDANLEGAYPASVGDVDGDGDPDIFAAGYKADTFVWYRNDGGGNFTRINIDTKTDGPHSIVTSDLDQDGDMDLVTSSQDAGTIAWYRNDGTNTFKRFIVDNTAIGAKRAEVADIDGDGDKDIVLASYDNRQLAWLENVNMTFTKHIFQTGVKGAYYVFPADIDGDGDIDIFHAAKLDNTIAWHRNDGTGVFEQQPIDTEAYGARSVIGVDLDLDGDVDALATSRQDDTLAWHENDGVGNFTSHFIDRMADGAYGVFAIDMDHDGDIDVLLGARSANEVSVHTQISASVGEVELGDTLVINSSLLLTTDSDDGPADLTYTLTDAPDGGQLRLDGAALTTGDTFTQADVNDGRLTYVHGGTVTIPDLFSFSVADGGEDGAQPVAGDFLIYILPPPAPPPAGE